MRNKASLTSKLQWATLVVMVAVVIALLVLLFTQQRSYRVDPREGESGVAGSSAPASASGSASGTAAAEGPAARQAEAARAVVNGTEDAVINVLGDSTSNTSTEWVYLWADQLGADAAVTVHTWNPATADWFQQTRNYGSGERTITIWNASAAEAGPSMPLAFSGMVQPEADLTILNYGHWGVPQTVATSLDELLDSLEAGAEGAAPVVLTAQNPALDTWFGYADTNREAMRTAAADRGLPVIDVQAAFEEAGDWQGLLVDEIHPGPEGQQLWAQTASDFFAA